MLCIYDIHIWIFIWAFRYENELTSFQDFDNATMELRQPELAEAVIVSESPIKFADDDGAAYIDSWAKVTQPQLLQQQLPRQQQSLRQQQLHPLKHFDNDSGCSVTTYSEEDQQQLLHLIQQQQQQQAASQAPAKVHPVKRLFPSTSISSDDTDFGPPRVHRPRGNTWDGGSRSGLVGGGGHDGLRRTFYEEEEEFSGIDSKEEVSYCVRPFHMKYILFEYSLERLK